MLVTFQSKASGSITMFGDIAVALLKLAGHSGTVPGALLAAQIPAALARLEQALPASAEKEGRQTAPPDAKAADTEPPVSSRQRAYPLMQMLSAAAARGCDVMWAEGQPAV